MAFTDIIIHSVWGTKNWYPFLTDEIRLMVIQHIRENARQKQIFIDTIDGHLEHVHCLFMMNVELSIAKTLQLLKGESSYWINLKKLTLSKFEWADEYFASSVSRNQLEIVRAYIKRQQEHHMKSTYAKEWDELISRSQG